MRKLFLVLLLTLSLLLPGCGLVDRIAGEPTQPAVNSNSAVLPKNFIQIGDSFDYYPDLADGHFECTVTDVRVASAQSQCPPKEQFTVPWACGVKDGEEIIFEYEEWFTDGGAFDLGVRLVMVDLTVTNVDAVAWLDNGLLNEDCGYFLDAQAFPTNQIVTLVNLSSVQGTGADRYYFGQGAEHFSRAGEFTEKDIPDTLGTENFAIKIMPGETAAFTVGFIVNGGEDGQPQDPSLWWLGIGNSGGYYVDRGRFIELDLGEE